MYVICGASGKTGSVAAETLLLLGKKVRAISRDARHLEALVQKGAEACEADMEDSVSLTKAFTGATAVYTLIPPNFVLEDFRAYQNRLSDSVSAAVKNSGVNHVVLLSSVGAQHASGTGPVVGLYEFEQKLNKVPGLNLLSVRASMFMENFMLNIGMVKSMGILGAPLPSDVPIPFIAAKDIGKYAAERLAALNFSGSTIVNLHGPLLSFARAASILGSSIGRPDLPFVQFTFDDAEKGLLSMGLKPQMASLYVEMYRGAAQRKLMFDPAGPEVGTPTTLEEFSQQFAQAFSAN